MPSSEEPKKNTGSLLDEVEIRDMTSVRNYSTPGAGSTPASGGGTRVGGQNIVTLEMPKEQTVTQFEPGRIHDSSGIRYSDVLRGVSPEVARTGGRFRVNELTRGPLAIEAEEEERIETEVQRRLAERLEKLREEATTAAHRSGFEAGRGEGRQEVLTELTPKVQAFETILGEFENMRLEMFKANEELLLHLVHHITRSIVLRELKDDGDYTRRLILHLIERLGTRENIKIFVAEAELSAVAALKEGLAQSLGQLKNISVEADPEIKQGGCRVETEFGEVDGRIEVQLQSITTGLGVAPSAT